MPSSPQTLKQRKPQLMKKNDSKLHQSLHRIDIDGMQAHLQSIGVHLNTKIFSREKIKKIIHDKQTTIEASIKNLTELFNQANPTFIDKLISSFGQMPWYLRGPFYLVGIVGVAASIPLHAPLLGMGGGFLYLNTAIIGYQAKYSEQNKKIIQSHLNKVAEVIGAFCTFTIVLQETLLESIHKLQSITEALTQTKQSLEHTVGELNNLKKESKDEIKQLKVIQQQLQSGITQLTNHIITDENNKEQFNATLTAFINKQDKTFDKVWDKICQREATLTKLASDHQALQQAHRTLQDDFGKIQKKHDEIQDELKQLLSKQNTFQENSDKHASNTQAIGFFPGEKLKKPANNSFSKLKASTL